MEIAKFRGVRTPKPLHRLIKIWRGPRGWLRQQWLPACQNSKRTPHWGRGGVCVKYHPRVVFSARCNIYMVIHNYGNPYEKWNIFVAWPHLWLKLEIMLCETVLNLSTLRYVTAQYPVTWRHVIGVVRQLSCLKWRPQISFLLGPGCKSGRIQSVVGNAGEGLQEVDQGHWQTACTYPDSLGQNRSAHYWYSQTLVHTSSCMHALELKADTASVMCFANGTVLTRPTIHMC